MSPEEIELREKLIKGIQLSSEQMIRRKQKENEDLYLSKNGEIIKIKAREIQLLPAYPTVYSTHEL